MKPRHSFAGTILLVLAFASAISTSTVAAGQGYPRVGHLTVGRVPNFGWNFAFNLQIDGRPAGTIVQGQRYDGWVPAGRHVLTVSKVPYVGFDQPTSTTVDVQPGWAYAFTVMWVSDVIYLRRFQVLSPGEIWQLRP
jgi:hypothetical protein